MEVSIATKAKIYTMKDPCPVCHSSCEACCAWGRNSLTGVFVDDICHAFKTVTNTTPKAINAICVHS